MLGGTVAYGLDGQPSGIDLQAGVTDDTLITRSDVRDGLFDGGELDVWEYDQASPSDGRVHQFWGRVDDVQRRREGAVKISAKGILAQSHQILVERYSPMCAWSFCDSRCGLNPDDFTYAATITAISADRYTLTISGRSGGAS
jgi:hypothetical protein